jgi:hypothetical protein
VALVHVSGGLSSDRAAAYIEPAAKFLMETVPKEAGPSRDAFIRDHLHHLVVVCEALPPNRPAADLEPAAKILALALGTATNDENRYDRSDALRRVCKVLSPDRAEKYLEMAAKLLEEDLAEQPWPRSLGDLRADSLADGLGKVCIDLPPDRGATWLLRAQVRQPSIRNRLTPSFTNVAGKSMLQASILVLKHPLCYGEARQVFHRRVEQFAGQQFKSRWEMADWLMRNHPETNPSAPPQGLE